MVSKSLVCGEKKIFCGECDLRSVIGRIPRGECESPVLGEKNGSIVLAAIRKPNRRKRGEKTQRVENNFGSSYQDQYLSVGFLVKCSRLILVKGPLISGGFISRDSSCYRKGLKSK